MANSNDSNRPPAQPLPDQLAQVRQRRQTHAGSRPSARRSTPQQTNSRDPSPPDGIKAPDRERRLTGAMVNGGLGIDEPAPDDVLDAMTGAPTSPAAPPTAPGTTPDDAVDARVNQAAESAGTHVTEAPDADNWLRHHHQQRQPQQNEPSRPRGSAELPTEPTRAARGRKRGPARTLTRPKATAADKTGGHSRRPASRWVIAIVLAIAVLVVAVIVIAENRGGHTTRTGRLTTAQVLSDGWHGADPRSSEHPAFPEPVEFRPARLGAAALTARRYVAKRIHHPSAPVTPARSSASSVSVPAASSDQPTEVTPAPQTTYTPPPATTTTAPTPSTGTGGGSSSTTSGGSSSPSSTKKAPAYGPTGSLGPGYSPDS